MTSKQVEEKVEEIMSLIPKMQVVVEVGDGENDMVDLEEVLPYELTKILTQLEAEKQQAVVEEREKISKLVYGKHFPNVSAKKVEEGDPVHCLMRSVNENLLEIQEYLTTEDNQK